MSLKCWKNEDELIIHLARGKIAKSIFGVSFRRLIQLTDRKSELNRLIFRVLFNGKY